VEVARVALVDHLVHGTAAFPAETGVAADPIPAGAAGEAAEGRGGGGGGGGSGVGGGGGGGGHGLGAVPEQLLGAQGRAALLEGGGRGSSRRASSGRGLDRDGGRHGGGGHPRSDMRDAISGTDDDDYVTYQRALDRAFRGDMLEMPRSVGRAPGRSMAGEESREAGRYRLSSCTVAGDAYRQRLRRAHSRTVTITPGKACRHVSLSATLASGTGEGGGEIILI